MTTPVPRRVLRQIAGIAREAARLESIIGIPYAAYADQVRLGYPNGGTGRGSDISDPTAAAALTSVNGFRTGDRDDVLGDIELLERRIDLAHTTLTGIADDIDRKRRLSPELAHAAWVVERCEVPECELNSVRAGMCWRHYRHHLAQRAG